MSSIDGWKAISRVVPDTGLSRAGVQKIAKKFEDAGRHDIVQRAGERFFMINHNHPEWIAAVEESRNETRGRERKEVAALRHELNELNAKKWLTPEELERRAELIDLLGGVNLKKEEPELAATG